MQNVRRVDCDLLEICVVGRECSKDSADPLGISKTFKRYVFEFCRFGEICWTQRVLAYRDQPLAGMRACEDIHMEPLSKRRDSMVEQHLSTNAVVNEVSPPLSHVKSSFRK